MACSRPSGACPDHGGWRFGNMGSAGPMARTAEDVALIQQVIAGPDRRVPSSLPEAAPDVLPGLDKGIAGLRVAWSPDHGRGSVDSMVIDTASSALAILAGAGANIEEIADRIDHPWGDGSFLAAVQEAVARGEYRLLPQGNIPEIPELEAMLRENSGIKGATAFGMPGFADLLASNAGLLTPPQQLTLKMPPSPESAGPAPAPDELRRQMQRIFAKFDVLCSPTMAVVAPAARPDWATPYPDMFMGTNLTFIANITSCPAITVPCGFVRDLPAGFQVIGRPGDEATVLRVAQAIDSALPLTLRPPL
jgi:Asp-tRNA(Asn)/Glu-tRNA(Gln) amidotransferase A subunit family amidase